jgi:hypothetical protein
MRNKCLCSNISSANGLKRSLTTMTAISYLTPITSYMKAQCPLFVLYNQREICSSETALFLCEYLEWSSKPVHLNIYSETFPFMYLR